MNDLPVLIVDDEPLARARLKRLLAAIPGYYACGEASDGRQAVLLAQKTRPRIVLLDISMPEMDGLETAKILAEGEAPPAVIFCTAHDEFALAAFRVRAVDYLLKPVRPDQLADALARVAKGLPGHPGIPPGEQKTGMSAEENSGMILAGDYRSLRRIPLETICCCIAEQKYVTVIHDEGRSLLDCSLKALEERFAPTLLRVHRHALVHTARIDSLEWDSAGHYFLRLSGCPEPVPVSRRRLPLVRTLLNEG